MGTKAYKSHRISFFEKVKMTEKTNNWFVFLLLSVVCDLSLTPLTQTKAVNECRNENQ